MPITIALATNERHIAEALRLRHTVFCEEEDLLPANASSMLIDEFDAFPTSKMIVVLDNDKVVGSVRVTLDSAYGLPADHYFDFRQHFTADDSLMNISMFCATKDYRSTAVSTGMLLMCAYYAAAHNIRHVVAPLNPPLAKMVIRMGARPLLDQPTKLAGSGLEFLPVAVDTNNLNEFFLRFTQNNMLYNMIGSYHCMLFNAGEHIISKGEAGDCAYVLVDGAAAVKDGSSDTHIASLGVGDVFGELALFSDDNLRTTDVVATTKSRVMVLPKAAFLDHVKQDPEASLRLLKTVSNRMRDMLMGAA